MAYIRGINKSSMINKKSANNVDRLTPGALCTFSYFANSLKFQYGMAFLAEVQEWKAVSF